MQGHVYLLHFERPICPERHTTQHYLGWALNWRARLADHRAGRGARLTQVAIERGISFDVVATWPGDRKVEQAVKAMKSSPRLCPVCGVKHPRGPRCLSYQQLALPLDLSPADEWPAPSRPLRLDWYELSWLRRRPVRRYDLGDTSSCDIPW